MTAWGYLKTRGIRGMVLKLVGHPHTNGRVRSQQVRKFLKKIPTLDIGCGEGIFCLELFKRKIPVVGIDIDETSLINAQRNFNKMNAVVKTYHSAAEKTPFFQNSFEQVICLDVLEHVKDPIVVIKEINRVLKTGGQAIITVPNELYLTKSVWGFDFRGIIKAVGHEGPGYDYPELKAMLESNGFVVKNHQYYYKFFSRLITELVFKLVGTKGFKKARKKMYKQDWLSIAAFCVMYPVTYLDYLLPRQKGGFVCVRAVKK